MIKKETEGLAAGFQLKTPVVLIVFNRPDATKNVFDAIAKAMPSDLLIIGDGPRADRHQEAQLVAKTRDIVGQVTWQCRVQTNYSDVNLGCKVRVSTGLDWVFDSVREAIILEDDCLPDPSFFQFCEEMLSRYRADLRIGMISGDNFQDGWSRNSDSYYFSKYFHVWGWASWRDRWSNCYDVSMKKWPQFENEGWLADVVGDDRDLAFWRETFRLAYGGKIDTWDYQWVFANWLQGRLCVLPNVNLVSNIGFGPDATHTIRAGALGGLPLNEMEFPMSHPIGVVRNAMADLRSLRRQHNSSYATRIRRLIMHFAHAIAGRN